MLVWLTDWQIAEDHILVESGGGVDWTVYPADAAWMTRLFGDRLAVEWQYDTYGDGVVQASRRVRGRVAAIQSVRCRQTRSDEGIVPVRGAAGLHEVMDTSASWTSSAIPPRRPSRSSDAENLDWRSCSTIFDENDQEARYGYIVAVEHASGDAASPRTQSPLKGAR